MTTGEIAPNESSYTNKTLCQGEKGRFTPTKPYTRERKNRQGKRENDPSTHILRLPILQRLRKNNKPKEDGVITHPIPDKKPTQKGKEEGQRQDSSKQAGGEREWPYETHSQAPYQPNW